MASPLSVHPEIFSAPPTLMPGSSIEEHRENWTAQEEHMPENWDTIPWDKHGVLSITSGIPNTKPDPTAQVFAQSAIRKATASAHRGITTILLLELQANLDLFPNAQSANRTLQMLKLVTIPAGRLAQWKGSSKWSANVEKGTLTSSDQSLDRPK